MSHTTRGTFCGRPRELDAQGRLCGHCSPGDGDCKTRIERGERGADESLPVRTRLGLIVGLTIAVGSIGVALIKLVI